MNDLYAFLWVFVEEVVLQFGGGHYFLSLYVAWQVTSKLILIVYLFNQYIMFLLASTFILSASYQQITGKLNLCPNGDVLHIPGSSIGIKDFY